ncbi:hypothetical protein M422DRAFT_50075 [Sphaerobolus stellatus SS14]|uniref:Unplaced genomic scaffold SPHSTscaffold_86, whole genome shotgun sequence n=1 Tax=Sphaerobolus stellatus (strain SS14) TaxID=990650 RepID=A0A0C9UU75_SPHS4|nr:hypothetical protein M422DRAFT_50075 [Sphaerobolus stellatus SS14]
MRYASLSPASHTDTNTKNLSQTSVSSPTKRTLVPYASLSIELKGTGVDDVEADVSTPRVTAYAPSTPPGDSNGPSTSNVPSNFNANKANDITEEDDSALKAFAAPLPASRISNLGNRPL